MFAESSKVGLLLK